MRSGVPIASRVSSARLGAPPCSGPDSAPSAPTRQAATSAPVEAMTRAVNVDALKPWSMVEIEVVLDRAGVLRVRLRAGEHVQVVGGVREVVARLDRVQAPAEPVQRGRAAVGTAARGGQRVARRCSASRSYTGRKPAARTEQRQRGAQPGERSGPPSPRRWPAARRAPRRAARAAPRSRAAKAARASRVGQVAVEQQMPDVLEAAGLRELDGGVLAVVVEALAPPDVTESRCR